LAVHALGSCPIPTPARVELAALGEFPISNNTYESLSLTAQNAKLAFPAGTLAVQATASADATDQAFLGYGERHADRLDFLLWPQGSSCELLRGDSYPGKLGGQALGYANQSGLFLAAGSNAGASGAVVGALTFDARTGAAGVVDPRAVLAEPRAFATVTEFGDQVLVAGGEYPIHDASRPASVLSHTAEVYDPVTQRFETSLLSLAVATTRHAAIVLESGETALFGGRTDASEASNFVQIVAPATRTSKLFGTLEVGRSAATLLRLSDGRVLVAGGEDAAGSPVPQLEWRAADASALRPPFTGEVSLPPRFDRAFAALPGGAALAVGGCEDREPAAAEDCQAWCTRGCPSEPDSTASLSSEAFWISADGSVTALDFPISATRPVLLAGSDGRPWLIAAATGGDGQPNPRTRALYRFDPWLKSFSRADSDLDSSAAARFVSTGPDAFVWLDEDELGSVLRGARLGNRSSYSSDATLIELPDPDDASRPAHLAPDRPLSGEAHYDGALSFAQADAGSTKACVWISDALFADFSASVEYTSSAAPALRIGARGFTDPSSSDTDPACQLPAAAGSGTLLVKRAGNQVALTIGAARSACQIGASRVELGLCASELGPVRLTRLRVTRGG
jgi:hypothetical protein